MSCGRYLCIKGNHLRFVERWTVLILVATCTYDFSFLITYICENLEVIPLVDGKGKHHYRDEIDSQRSCEVEQRRMSYIYLVRKITSKLGNGAMEYYY